MSSTPGKIEHEGTVIGIEGDVILVSILSKAACGSCSASHLCSAAESKEKTVEAMAGDGLTHTVGERVIVEGEESLGPLAVMIAYVSPLLFVLAGLLTSKAFGADDAVAGLIGLSALLPYYALLRMSRGRLEKKFKFKTRKQS